MSNPLQVNPETGFLESPSSANTGLQRNYFNSDRKLRFLAMIDEAIENNLYPSIREICRHLGISIESLNIHLRKDKVFAAEWNERRMQLQSVFTVELSRKAMKDSGTIANLAMLRWLESGTWLPETRINHVTDNHGAKAEFSTIKGAIDAEIVPEFPQTPASGDAQP